MFLGISKHTIVKAGIKLGVVAIFLLFYYLPLIIQDQVTEELTAQGGSLQHQYVFLSLREIVNNQYCMLNCFPSIEKTISFNMTAIVVESAVFLILSYFTSKILFTKFLKSVDDGYMTVPDQIALLQKVRPTQSEAALAWDYIIEAVADEYITLDQVRESLAVLDGDSGTMTWDEFSIDDDPNDSSRVSVYYIAFTPSTVTCPKTDILEAYYALQHRD